MDTRDADSLCTNGSQYQWCCSCITFSGDTFITQFCSMNCVWPVSRDDVISRSIAPLLVVSWYFTLQGANVTAVQFVRFTKPRSRFALRGRSSGRRMITASENPLCPIKPGPRETQVAASARSSPSPPAASRQRPARVGGLVHAVLISDVSPSNFNT